jgi:hypothetical protein
VLGLRLRQWSWKLRNDSDHLVLVRRKLLMNLYRVVDEVRARPDALKLELDYAQNYPPYTMLSRWAQSPVVILMPWHEGYVMSVRNLRIHSWKEWMI